MKVQNRANHYLNVSTLRSVSLLLLLLLLSTLTPILSQERKYYGIVINPAIKHITLNPGESYSGSIELINDFQHQETVDYYPFSQNFKQLGETGNADFYQDENLPQAINPYKWITFGEDKYVMPFGEKISSNFTINVPTDTPPGGYYAGLIYISSDPTSEQFSEETVSLNSAISSLLFITVDGDVNEDGELIQFTTDKERYEFMPVEYIIRYNNNGNIHSTIGGNIFIHKGDITQPVEILKVNEDSGISLPGSTRTYSEKQHGGFLYFDSNGKLRFDRESFPKLYFGKYTATLKLKHPSDGERITTDRSVTFWIIPWRLVIVVALIITGVASFIVLRRKRYNKS